jgi:hypothetical protein
LGLADREQNAWILDGFSAWWPDRRSEDQTAAAWRSAASGKRRAISNTDEEELARWYSLRHDFGDERARLFAAVGLAALAENQGQEECRRFLAASFAPVGSENIFWWLRDLMAPPAVRLQQTAGLSLKCYIRQWREAMVKGQEL